MGSRLPLAAALLFVSALAVGVTVLLDTPTRSVAEDLATFTPAVTPIQVEPTAPVTSLQNVELPRLQARIAELEAQLAALEVRPSASPEEVETPEFDSDSDGSAEEDGNDGALVLTDEVLAELGIAEAAAQASQNGEVWLMLAQLYLMADDYQRAGHCLVRAATLNPEDEELPELVGEFPVERRVPLIQKLLRVLPNSDELWGDLGDVYQEQGNFDLAARAFGKALEADPSDDEWAGKLAELDPATAITLLEPMLQAHPEEAGLIGNLAEAYAKGGNTSEAIAQFERAFALNPEWGGRLAELDPARAVRLLEQHLASPEAAVSIDGVDERWGDLGDAYTGVGRAADAGKAYLHAMELDPEDEEWIKKLATVDPQAVIDRVEPLHAKQEASSAHLKGLADAYAAIGRTPEATALYLDAIGGNFNDDDLLKKLANLDPDLIVARLEKASTEAGDDDEVWGNLGDAYQQIGRSGEALRCYRKAHELDGEDEEWPEKIKELGG